MDIQQFEGRKKDHIEHALSSLHQATGLNGLEQVSLIHEALPEFDFSEVDTSTDFFGTTLRTPFYIAGMTAGHSHAVSLNHRFAEASQERGWAMGVGSQRRDLQNPPEALKEWADFRKRFPKLKLFSNIGITQITSAKIDDIRRLCEMIEADFLFVHLNALQEVIQPEGTPHFKGTLEALIALCQQLPLRVGIKETGCGFSKATLNRLKGSGIKAVDVSGLGGTHWGRMEGARAASDSVQAQAAQTFSNWGISTTQSVLNAKCSLLEETEIWASGGVRSGLDAAKLLALGAHRVGYAQPALKAGLEGEKALHSWMQLQEFELKTALFCTGVRTIQSLRKGQDLWTINEK